MPNNVITIDDGETVINLSGVHDSDGISYTITPNSRPARTSQFARNQLSEEVYESGVESFTLRIEHHRPNDPAGPNLVHRALNRLIDVINNAILYDRGLRDQPVLLKERLYNSPTSSTYPLTALILPPTGKAVTAPPSAYRDALGSYMDGVRVTVPVRPIGINVGAAESSSSFLGNYDGGLVANFSEAPRVWVPSDFSLGTFAAGGGSAPGPGILVIAPAGNAFQVIDASIFDSFSSPGQWSDIGSIPTALGGALKRYTPANTAAQNITGATDGAIGRRIAMFAMLKNNTAGIEYLIRGQARVDNTLLHTPPVVVDGSNLNPRAVCLGIVESPKTIGRLGLQIIPSATGGTIDVNYVFAADLTRGPASIHYFEKIDLPAWNITSGNWSIRHYHNYTGNRAASDAFSTTGPVWVAQRTSDDNIAPIAVHGDQVMYTAGDEVVMMLMMPDGANWYIAGNRTNCTASWTRDTAALSPQ